MKTENDFLKILLMAMLFCAPGCIGLSGGHPMKKPGIEIFTPVNHEQRILGSEINIRLTYPDKKRIPDSLVCIANNLVFKRIPGAASSIQWKADIPETGSVTLEIQAFFPDGIMETAEVKLVMLSDITPDEYGYRILSVFPHDKEAFTQGLLFDNQGSLYESTGNYGRSTIRKVSLKDGSILLQKNLPGSFFGEGIALVGGLIYQLTWNERTVFVYQKETLQEVKRIPLPTREGWGLTYDGEHLILSDGSSTLYFLEEGTLKEIRRIEVCDHQKPLDNLNELEYIQGEIWANVYMTDLIARIDPLTGKVIAYIHLDHLLNEQDKTPETNVLNGIAINPVNSKIYVTGKNWPKLFEIEPIRK